jgi:hypothetical protein
MAVKTIEAYVDVDVNLDDFEDQELIDEIESRGYHVSDDPTTSVHLDDADLEYLLELLDKQGVNWYNTRVRDKVFGFRYQGN